MSILQPRITICWHVSTQVQLPHKQLALQVADVSPLLNENLTIHHLLNIGHSSTQVQPLYEELAPCIGDLLRCRRSGVVAALLAACGRANCCQKEACSALAAAIASTPQSSGKT
eukprot:scaffold141890_cov20-Tisochrysis_lutea.AAC.1